MGNLDALFNGMEKAEGFGTGQYFTDGRYDVIVRAIKMVVSRDPKKLGQHLFTVECEIASSTNPEVEVGSKRTYQVKLEGNTYAFADIKNFVFAMLGKDPDKVLPPARDPASHKEATEIVKALCDEEYLAKLSAENSPIVDRVLDLIDAPLKLEAFKKQTRPTQQKPNGGVFTIHKWSPADVAAPS